MFHVEIIDSVEKMEIGLGLGLVLGRRWPAGRESGVLVIVILDLWSP
jgi:hypothetical protein